MNKKLLLFTIAICSLNSCVKVPTSEVIDWTETDNLKKVVGKHHVLDRDDIKIYLPGVFKKYHTSAYQNLLDSLLTKEAYQYELKRLETLKEMEGNFYVFFDTISQSTYTINSIPFTAIKKEDAKLLLGNMNMNYKKITENSDLTFEKLTAKYVKNSEVQIFKAVHKLDNKKAQNNSMYSTNYIMSSKENTVMISLTTGFEVDFDPYLPKMRF